jgi:hypothetical protein
VNAAGSAASAGACRVVRPAGSAASAASRVDLGPAGSGASAGISGIGVRSTGSTASTGAASGTHAAAVLAAGWTGTATTDGRGQEDRTGNY